MRKKKKAPETEIAELALVCSVNYFLGLEGFDDTMRRVANICADTLRRLTEANAAKLPATRKRDGRSSPRRNKKSTRRRARS